MMLYFKLTLYLHDIPFSQQPYYPLLFTFHLILLCSSGNQIKLVLTHWFNKYPSSPGSLQEELQMKRKIIFRLQCGSYLLSSLKNYIYYIIQTFQNTDEKLKFVVANDLLALGSFRRNITTQIIWLFDQSFKIPNVAESIFQIWLPPQCLLPNILSTFLSSSKSGV